MRPYTFRLPKQENPFRFYFLVTLVVFGLKAVILMHGSLSYGRLTMPPVYDDVTYFIDALERMRIVLNHGMLALILDLASHPPHAPYSTLAAMLAFMFGGPNLVWPYIANAATMAILAAILFHRFRLGSGTTWCVAAVLVTTPWFDNAVTIFHPDMIAGFATAVVAALLIWQAEVIQTRRRAILLGCFAGAALLIKPVAFPVMLGLWGMAFAIGGAIAFDEEKTIRLVAMRLILGTGTGLIVAGSYFAHEFSTIITYIYGGLVVQREVWSHVIAKSEHTFYYFNAARSSFGYWFPAAVAGCGFVAALGLRNENRPAALRFAGFMLVTAAGYAIPESLEVKFYLFGSIFYACIAVALILSIHFLLDRFDLSGLALKFSRWGIFGSIQQPVRYALIIVLSTTVLIGFSDKQGRYNSPMQHAVKVEYDGVYGRMEELVDLRRRAGVALPDRLVAYIPLAAPVPPPAYRFRGLLNGLDIVLARTGNVDERSFVEAAMRSTIVIIPDDEALKTIYPYPEKKFIPAFREWLWKNKQFTHVAAVRTALGSADIFAKVPAGP